MAKQTRSSSERDKRESTALTAAALQDHVKRSLCLQDPFMKKKINHELPVTRRTKITSKLGKKSAYSTPGRNYNGKNHKLVDEEKECVLDPMPKPLNLAQKLGLVDSPQKPLTENEWQEVKQASNARNDSSEPCVICKEEFGLEQQVLLSCSHVFHRICLRSYERFSGKKTCPMCRKEQYQTRLVQEGAKQHRVKCAIRIQALWRGYVVRCLYRKFREENPPKDPRLRKKFYENKLSKITQRILNSFERNEREVNNVLLEADRSMAYSKDIMRQFDVNTFRPLNESEWEEIQLKAGMRDITECPICMMSLEETGHNSPLRRTVALLSCSHVYHSTCLQTFEEFALSDRRQCPVCRSGYQRKIF